MTVSQWVNEAEPMNSGAEYVGMRLGAVEVQMLRSSLYAGWGQLGRVEREEWGLNDAEQPRTGSYKPGAEVQKLLGIQRT